MALESVTHISDLNASNPAAGDAVSQGDDHIRNIKTALLTDFPSITGAVTSTHTELNLLDGVTSTTAELNILDGVTSTAAELNILDGVTAVAADLNVIAGGAAAGVTATEFQYLNGVTSAIQTQLDAIGIGQQAIWVPAAAMTAQSTSGPAAGSTETSTYKNMFSTLDFGPSADEYAYFVIQMPKSWDAGTLICQFVWTATGGSATQTVLWQIEGVSLADNDALDTDSGTPVGASTIDQLIATGDVHITLETDALTVTGATAEELVLFEVWRDVSGDTLADDAQLIGVKLHYTVDATTDS